MILGAEFQRHIWMRFSWFSLLIVPVIIGFIAIISYMSFMIHDEARQAIKLMNDVQTYMPDPHWSFRSLFATAPILFIALYFLGIYECATSFTGELKNKTWDIQKISAISPLHLVIGKLLGAPSYAWYITLWTLPFVLYAYANMFEVLPQENTLIQTVEPELSFPSPHDIISSAICVIIPVFLGQIIASYASLNNLMRNRTGALGPFALGFFAAASLHSLLSEILNIKLYALGPSGMHNTIEWYGRTISNDLFVLGTLIYVIIVASVALYRMARKELNFPSYPFIWILFLISVSFYLIGVSDTIKYSGDLDFTIDWSKPGITSIPFAVFFTATFMNIWNNAANLSGYQRFFNAIKRKNPKKILETVPEWMVTSIFMVASLIIGIMFFEWSNQADTRTDQHSILILIIALTLFFIRDAIILHIFTLGNRLKRGAMYMALFYLFAYVLIPVLIFYGVQIWNGSQIQANELFSKEFAYRYIFAVFYPSIQEGYNSYALGFTPPVIQIMIASLILWRTTKPYRLHHESEGK